MSESSDINKTISIAVAIFVGLGLVTWGGIYINGFFNTEREAQRTKVLQESFAYQRGMQDELNQLYLQYQSADTNERIGIRAVVRDKFGVVDTNSYPDYLQTFLNQVRTR